MLLSRICRRCLALLIILGLPLGAFGQKVKRPQAPWPPPAGPLRVIIDTDAGAEVDDQYALSLALGFPERLRLEGIVAAHFGDDGGHAGIDKSLAEIDTVLERAGRKGQIPVKRGADPVVYRDRMPSAEGVDFIIERALSATPVEPLWLVLLGPPTDAVAALAKAPQIADRLVVFWHGRTQWPLRCWNFNAYNDIKAARFIFELPSRFILFDTGTYLTISMEETARRFSLLGTLGKYLHDIRSRSPGFQTPRKAMFDLGDIAALVDPACVQWERAEAPRVDHDLRYDFSQTYGEIVRIYYVERDRTYDLLEHGLVRLANSSPKRD